MKMEGTVLNSTQLAGFVDELEKIAARREKDAGGFDSFLGGAGKALKSAVSSAPRAAQSIGKALPRAGAGGFVPAVVGAAERVAKKLPLPTGALNPGGGFH